MLFFLLQLLLIIVYGNALATYESSCLNTCDLPGLICVSGRCYCDWNRNLFWTGLRCLACPVGWLLTGIRCVNYFENELTWTQAAEVCRKNQADLITFRDTGEYSLIYQATATNHRRKKRTIATDRTVGWTSAREIDFTGLGTYQWSDTSQGTFSSQSPWWCRQNTPGFTPYYPYNEPTRRFYTNAGESCTVFRRGTTSIAALCLDDVLCDASYPFICERSESTAQKYSGPPPSSGGTEGSGSHGDTEGSGSHHNTGGGGDSTGNMNSNTQNNPHGAKAPDALESKPKKKSKLIIVAFVAFASLLIGALIGIFFFIKRGTATGTQYNVGANHNKRNPIANNVPPPTKTDAQPPAKVDTKENDIGDVDAIPIQPPDSDEMALTLNTDMKPGNLGFNIGNQKQMKRKHGGYSQQQFQNEFE